MSTQGLDRIVKGLRSEPLPKALYMFDSICGYHPHPRQFEAQLAILAYPETANCWGRQLGKTLWDSLTGEFMSVVLGMRGAFRTPMEGQCEAPLEYWQSTPFFEGMSDGWAKFGGKRMIHLGPITNNNMRSKTLDYIIYDEEASCTKKQDLLLDVGEYMVQNSKKRRVVHVSTPMIGTKFESNFTRLEALGKAFRYTYKDFQGTSWINAAMIEIQKKKAMVESGHYPRWLFLQEVDAIFAAQGGSIFSDYEMGVIPIHENQPEYIGIDINPKAGHTAIVSYFLPPSTFYVKEQIDLGTNTEYAATVLRNRSTWRTHIEFEMNGPGEEAYKTFMKVFKKGFLGKFTPVHWDEQNKFNRVMQLLACKIVVNPQAKDAWEQIRGASWDPNKKLAPFKTPNDHWIDATYHAGAGVEAMSPQKGFALLQA